ncbi:hypothetical protein B0O80DRAFT_234333 [Mortierella sp. GBAus27b]|nr:hypothetical protein B0O80DRAFT_234333 [Mortierella sp. GBAus27b]
MQLTFALPMAVAIAAQFIPQAMAADPFKPITVVSPDIIMAGSQELYISSGWRPGKGREPELVDQFFALDLGRSWKSDAPAWKKLKLRETHIDDKWQGVVGSTLGNDLFFFDNNGTYVYNITTDDWSKDDALTFPYSAMTGGIVTVKGLIYGMEGLKKHPAKTNGTWVFTELNTTSKTYTFTEHRGRPDQSVVSEMVYSPITDTIFAYESGDSEDGQSLFSFNLTSKTWALVNGTGDVPPSRYMSCFTASQDGTVLILAGGYSVNTEDRLVNDVYSFDVRKSVWTKLASAPRPAIGPVCAVWSNQFIYWGGSGYSGMNDEGPAILNLTSKTWGTIFDPHGASPTPSSADRALSLSNIGLAMVTMISIAVSTLML